MASANTLCAEIINVKGTVVTNHEFYNDSDGIKHLRIHVRPNKFSAKFSLSSYLRHTMYYAGNTAVI